MEESWNTETKTARGILNVSLKCHSLDHQTCETKVILRSTQHSTYQNIKSSSKLVHDIIPA